MTPETEDQRLQRFLDSLFAQGEVEIVEGPVPAAGPATEALLNTAAARWADELAGDGPEWNPEAGLWAARILYAACQGVVCRDLGEEELAASLRAPCPRPRSPSVDWSVDICLQYLPEVHRMARHFSAADPLVRELQTLAQQWPLSSVGIPGLPAVGDLEPFVSDAALLQLYVDRVLERHDVSRLGHGVVDAALRSALGAHPELCPELAYRLMPHAA